MALFDGRERIQAPPEMVWQAAYEFARKGKIEVEQPHTFLMATQLGAAFAYLLKPQPDGSTSLRHVINRAGKMHIALQENLDPEVALETLTGKEPGRLDDLLSTGKEALAALSLAEGEHTNWEGIGSGLMQGQERIKKIKVNAEHAAQSAGWLPVAPAVEPEPTYMTAPAPTLAQLAEQPAPQPDESVKPGKKPWNPTLFPILAFLFSFAASGILAGINWRRLGRPRLMWPTIAGSIIGLIAMLWFFMAADVGTPAVGYVLNIGLGALFMLWQKAAYRRWETEHPEALQWKSGWIVPAVVSVGVLAFAVAAIFGLTAASMTPTLAAIDHYNRGIDLGAQQKWDEAIAEYTLAVQSDANLTEAYLNRGHAYFQKSNWKAALADFDKAIALDSNLEMAYRNRGLVYAVMGKSDQAITDAHRATQLDPSDATAFWLCGLLHADQNEKAEAKADLKQAMALGLDPDMKQTAEEALKQLE